MIKTLDSGLRVRDDEYYELLQWLDRHKLEFNKFCDSYSIPDSRRSINKFTSEEYCEILKYME